MKYRYVDCACGTGDHVLRFVWDPDEPEEMWTEVHLCPGGFWWRLKRAFKYLFNIGTCPFGYFDCTLLMPQQVDQLYMILNEYMAVRNKPKEEGSDGLVLETKSD